METKLSSDVIRGFSDLMILYVIYAKPSYGYEISKRIRELSDDRYAMKETTLYSAFKRLEQNGYLKSFAGKETSGKKRTYYELTEKGRCYYGEKCKEWELTKLVIENFILTN